MLYFSEDYLSFLFSFPSRSIPGLLRGARRWPQHQWHVPDQTGRDGKADPGVVWTGNRQWGLDCHPDQERRIRELLQELGQLQGDDCWTSQSSVLHFCAFGTSQWQQGSQYIKPFRVAQTRVFPEAKKKSFCFHLLKNIAPFQAEHHLSKAICFEIPIMKE